MKPSKNIRTLLHILTYSAGSKSKLFWGTLTVALQSILFIGAALALGKIIDPGLTSKNVQTTLTWLSVLVGIQVVILFCGYQGKKLLYSSATSSLLEIRKAVFRKIETINLGFFAKNQSGEIVTRMTQDIEYLDEFFSDVLVRVLSILIAFAFMGLSSVFIDPQLGGIVLLSTLPVFAIAFLSRKTLKRNHRRFIQLNAQTNGKMMEQGFNLFTIRAFQQEAWSSHIVGRQIQKLENQSRVLLNLRTFLGPLIHVLCYLPIISLIALAGPQVFAGTLQLGLFVAYLRISQQFVNPIQMLASEIQNIQGVMADSERILGFLDDLNENQVLNTQGSLAPQKIQGEIQFMNVSKQYDEQENKALDQVYFKINPGEHVAFVGRTGSGKSTAAKTLLRLFEFQSGKILLDGIDIRRYKVHFLREQIGFVTQDSTVFPGTIKENLIFDESKSDGEIYEACSQTGLLDILEKKGLSVSSHLDPEKTLSYGEKQLLSLTRVFLRSPSILILDEATAGMDSQLEQIVSNAQMKLMNGRTTISIAHKTSAIENVDRIFYFSHGTVSTSPKTSRGDDQWKTSEKKL